MSDVDLGKAYVVIREWSIVQVHSKESGLFEIFVGFIVTDDIRRISFVIQSFDTTNRLGVTNELTRL